MRQAATDFRRILAVSSYEWQIMLRSRWLAAFALLFAVLGALLFYWNETLFMNGAAQGLTRQSMLLVNMLLQLVPLMGLLLSSLSLSGERSDGMTRLLRTYPLTDWQYVAGKFLGLVLAFLCAILAGVVVVYVGTALLGWSGGVRAVSTLLLTSVPLVAAFTAVGLWLGSWVKSRLQAVAGSLLLWFFFVYLYGMLTMSVLPTLPRIIQEPVLAGLLMLNPVETVRIATVFWQGQGYLYGPTFYYWEQAIRTPGGIAGAMVLLMLYMSIPLLLASRTIRKGA
ncbi:ABC transporter permease [Aneurinibacillus sp. REN35]|uniref:ABC transporter permease n=1 Tax=Aneurinibacillus sp. REN35 TaxID=3237286 RepID=UPI003526FEE2